MTADTGKKLYYLYCFVLGLATLPIALTSAILCRIPLNDDEKMGACLLTVLLMMLVAGISPFLRFRGFRQYWPRFKRMIGGMLALLAFGVIIHGTVIMPLLEPLLIKTGKPLFWYVMLIANPLASCVLLIDLILAQAFDGRATTKP